MKVNEIKETKEIIVKTEYIAADGKVFNDAETCKEYEKSYKGTISASFKKIPQLVDVINYEYIPWANDCSTIVSIIPRSFDDIVIINAYVESTFNIDCKLTQESIGKMIILAIGECNDWCDIYDADDFLESIIKNFTECKAKMTSLEEAKEQA